MALDNAKQKKTRQRHARVCVAPIRELRERGRKEWARGELYVCQWNLRIAWAGNACTVDYETQIMSPSATLNPKNAAAYLNVSGLGSFCELRVYNIQTVVVS